MKFNSFNFAVVLIFMAVAVAYFDISRAEDTIKVLDESKGCQDSGLTPHNGSQIRNENTCVSLEIGELPDFNHMVSCVITRPFNEQQIKKNTNFTVKIAISNLATGFFSDPAVDYYQIQQTLDNGGVIQGHSHITIQKLKVVNRNVLIPDPRVFAFFKGLNDAAVKGVLSVVVTNGLPVAGTYRICVMNSSNSHQPVVMPVAQRGAQDDCIRINVVD